MNILVTGGTGFLGSHLCRRLAERGHNVSVLRRPSSNLDALAGVDVRYATGDVRDADSLRRAAGDHEIVIHAAAGLTGPGSDERSCDVNVEGTHNVVEACLRCGVRRLVHVSSVAAVGIPENRVPANEDFRFNLERAGLHYHLSKHRAEGAVAEGVARGLDAVIVNPASLWGPSGWSYRGIDMVRMVRGVRTLRYSPGGVCVVHVEDVAEGIVAAMERGASGERYILGGDNLSFHDWMAAMADAVGSKPLLVPIPGFVTDAMAFALKPLASNPRFYGRYLRAYLASRSTFYDSSKAARELVYAPRSFDAILEECVEFL